ncbi:MAG: glycerol-3-phosphate 1-O-acyltransferase PlsY [Coriobacteriia bacterium]|nr:glycerol-3-phosphate 1-O-acyltransferase PlsY [Coriobacteriia bacterium]
MDILIGVVIWAVSFLLGSIPWGYIFSKMLFHEDVREKGSGNIGTTNMMRTYGKKVGVGVFLLDFAKGLIASVIAYFAGQAMGGTGTADVMGVYLGVSFWGVTWGHIFSPWLGFKGGKGIATAIGSLFVVFGPILALLEIAIFVALVPTTRYVSLGSVACAVACPFFALYHFWGNWPAVVFCALGGIMVVVAHRGNIQRLLNGTERRIGDKKKTA